MVGVRSATTQRAAALALTLPLPLPLPLPLTLPLALTLPLPLALALARPPSVPRASCIVAVRTLHPAYRALNAPRTAY